MPHPDYDPKDPPEELIITLRKSVEHLGDTLAELRLREPTAGELKAVSKKEATDADVWFVAQVAGIPEKAIEKITARDLTAATKYLMCFLPSAPTIGAPS